MLERSGFADIRTVSECLNRLAASIDQHDLQEVAQDRLHRVMPVLLSVISRQADPDGTLARVLPIVGAIERRSTYVAYLLENPDALKRTVELCAMSPWVAEQLNEHPILLYELTDAKTGEFSFTDADLTAQLDDLLMALDPTDDEVQMDTLRVFKSGAILRVAVCELLGLLPIMKASDALTVIAEIVLQRSIDLAWRYLEQKHGSPSKDAERKFVTIAYGKLGGIELAYGSDLDLVFLYEGDSQAETSGPRPISNSVLFSRLAQRIIHILSSFTRFGKLYEADMRLRPSGNQGPIVTTMTAFERYQREQAWTWEHQALIRARFVAGDPGLGARFEDIRRSILRQPRTREDVLHDVVTMRENTTDGMREQAVLLSGFDLKHEIGAIVDIEFMVQYAVLAWAEQHSDLTRWTDNMRLLEEICALELLDTEAVELLQKAYLAYRSAIHYQWLGGEMASFDVLNQYRQAVHSLWQRQMLDKAT
jgi:glutamate-ammonia-ligase adenylyltransferase